MLRAIFRSVLQPKPILWAWPKGSVALRPRQYSTLAPSSTSSSNTSKPQLRDYQERCIKAVLQALKHGHKRVGISLATGSGKTVIFTQLIERISDKPDGGAKTLILAHRRELVEQAARHCELAYPDKKIDIEMGSLHASGSADITIASVQSINSKDRLDKYDPSHYKLILVDEAHHIVAPGYMRVLKHFGLDQKQSHTPSLVGVSATFSRFDGVKLGAAIDQIVYHKDYVDMISERWLADVVFTTVESTANLSKVRSTEFGDFQTGDLSRAVNTDQINDITVRSWLAKAPHRRSTLVFCVDIAHVIGLTETFRQHGLDARFITGDTPKVERSQTLDAFKNHEFPVLVNCGVFTEGTDIPNIDCIILARPTRSRNLLVQMIGRGMRLYPGKENCHIIDLVSSLETGVVTTPTLFGLNSNELVDTASLDDMKRLKRAKIEEDNELQAAYARGDRQKAAEAVTFTDYSSVLDLIADTSGEKHIRAISQYAWVQVSPNHFVLSAPSGSYIRIEKITDKIKQSTSISRGDGDAPEPNYRVLEIRALPPGVSKSPYATPREILTATTFSDAVHGADTYAANGFPHSFIHRYQPWRSLPPTQNQVDFINKLRGNTQPLKVSDLTKGKAADMITKLKHGARGQFTKIEAQQRKQKRQNSVVDERLERETVRVGPVMA